MNCVGKSKKSIKVSLQPKVSLPHLVGKLFTATCTACAVLYKHMCTGTATVVVKSLYPKPVLA